jgi:hypothetical protein
MRLKLWIPALLLCCLPFAASASPALAQDEIPESKRRVILELVEIFNQQTSVEQIVDTTLAQMETIFPQMMSSAADRRTDLSQKEKEALREEAVEGYARFSARYRERVSKEVNFRKFQEEVSVPLYDKFFTEQELRDLIAFYRTPTGRKSLQVMPELLAESMQQAAAILGPQISRIVDEVIQEELEASKKRKKNG